MSVIGKGHLGRGHLWALAALTVVPLVLLALRLAPVPATAWIGDAISLTGLSEGLRHRASYVLILPLGAVIVVLVRLTLGLRMLGPFRSVLLAVAFQITGVALGLAFVIAVSAVTVCLRPALKAMRLPYFGRVCTLLGTVSALMVLAILCADWLDLAALERVAYFPVVVLCLIGEGFGRTLSNDGPRAAAVRGLTTIVVALAITALAALPGLGQLLLAHPELVLLEVAAIVLICEYADWRLIERLRGRTPDKASEEASDEAQSLPVETSLPEGPRVALVRNRSSEGVICQFGRPSPEKYGKSTIQSVLEALRARGYVAEEFEADMTLLGRLKEFLGPDPVTGRPRGIVFNMAYGIQGESRYTHVPAMLEMAGLPYTGADPLGHAVSLDKVTAKILMREAGLPTPAFRVMGDPEDPVGDLRYPLIIKPRHESTSNGLHVARTRAELACAVADVVGRYSQDALVEEFIEGREFCVGLVGNNPVTCLPPVELDFGGRALATFTKDDKFHRTADEPRRICPADIAEDLQSQLESLALATARVCHTRDYARVDLRLDRHGRPFVLEINSMASLGAGGSFVHAALCTGYTFESLIDHIVQSATARVVEAFTRSGRERRGAMIETVGTGAAVADYGPPAGAPLFQLQQRR